MTDLDPAVIMAAHKGHAAYDDGACKPWIPSRGPVSEHCHTYRLAAALAAAQERERRIARAWTVKGRAPRIHEQAQERLLHEWPVLARAVCATVRAALAGEGAADRCNEPDPSDSTAEGCSNRKGHGPDKGHLWSGEGAADQPQGEPIPRAMSADLPGVDPAWAALYGMVLQDEDGDR